MSPEASVTTRRAGAMLNKSHEKTGWTRQKIAQGYHSARISGINGVKVIKINDFVSLDSH